MAIDVEALKAERDALKETLRDLENEQRKAEAAQKKLRQKEIRTKRTIEALETLIDVGGTEATEGSSDDKAAASP